jgi:glucosamine-phosphate N-acetyltransferase
MASHAGLFSSDLISPTIAASLPETYTIRALQKDDYAKGFLDCLRVLTTVGDITEAQFNERYDFMNTQGQGAYYLLVIEDRKRIVGTGALIVEKKLCVLQFSPNSGSSHNNPANDLSASTT